MPNAKTADIVHDRPRRHILADGLPVPFLVETGVMTSGGRVRAKHYRKFRQINRYVEFIADIVDRLPEDKPVRVVDFGCGKSHLTFATHHYLTEIAGRQVDILGLDCREDVIADCRSTAQRLNLQGLRFECGKIADCGRQPPVHLVVSLHACDTATDDALLQGVEWNSDVILAVPCCQHELHQSPNAPAVPALSRHGILQERFCALSTDAVRAAILESLGWSTQVVEFIDMDHTAKNLLIQAVRRTGAGPDRRSRQAAAQVKRFCDQFGIPELHLQRKLSERGLAGSPGAA